jgi:hypothetical protein
MEDDRRSHDLERERREIIKTSCAVRREAQELIAQARALRSTAESTRRYLVARWHDPPHSDGDGDGQTTKGRAPRMERSNSDD